MRPAPPAANGVAPDVPPPTSSADLSISSRYAAHESQESETMCGGKPGHVFTNPESWPPTMIADGPKCGLNSVGCPRTPPLKAAPFPDAQNARCFFETFSTDSTSLGLAVRRPA